MYNNGQSKTIDLMETVAQTKFRTYIWIQATRESRSLLPLSSPSEDERELTHNRTCKYYEIVPLFLMGYYVQRQEI